jgi:serine/threonine protein kinase
MESVTSVHPSDETLVSYGKGKLDETVAESVQKHLEQCDVCRGRAAEVSGAGVDAGPETVGNAAETKTVAGSGRSSGSVTVPWPIGIGIPPELTSDPHYEVMRELGRGGMGVVYLARNKLMNRLEVLKVLNKEMLAKHGTAERFLREIQSAAKLHHPNVVAAYTALQMGELLVFAMEYVEGSDLAKLIRTRGPLPVLNACYFALQAAQGLQHAHERGMIHRDIKPGNLILLRQGKKAVVKILDFGLAKVTSEQRIDGTLTQQGQMLGTPDYIAPEQTLDAQKADIRSDIYSLGCTLYHLLTGSPPFQGNSLYEVLQAHHSVDAKPLNLVRPDVPVELAAVVAKMMAKEPKCRYQTPAEVVQALRPFVKPGGLMSPQPQLSPATSQAAQRWESLIDTPPLDRPSEAPRNKKHPARGRTHWLRPAAAMCVLVLGLLGALAAGVFSPNTSILVLKGLPEKADVLVDGAKASVRTPEEDADAEITVAAGNRKIEVKKEGFAPFEQEVTLARGDKKVLPVLLIPSPSVAPGPTPPAQPGIAVATTSSTPSGGAANQTATRRPTVLGSSREKTSPDRTSSGSLPPAPGAVDSAQSIADGSNWKSLMDWDGWTEEDEEEERAIWRSRDGQITGTAGRQMSGRGLRGRRNREAEEPRPSYVLTSGVDYSNFRLRFDFARDSSDAWGAVALRAVLQEKLDGEHPSHPLIVLGGSSKPNQTGTSRWLRGMSEIEPDQPPEMRHTYSSIQRRFSGNSGFVVRAREPIQKVDLSPAQPSPRRSRVNTEPPSRKQGKISADQLLAQRRRRERDGGAHPGSAGGLSSWNHMEIEVNGRSVRAWLNEKELLRSTPEQDARLPVNPKLGVNRIKGRIGLGIAKGSMRFREIEIKELPASVDVSRTAVAPAGSTPVPRAATIPAVPAAGAPTAAMIPVAPAGVAPGAGSAPTPAVPVAANPAAHAGAGSSPPIPPPASLSTTSTAGVSTTHAPPASKGPAPVAAAVKGNSATSPEPTELERKIKEARTEYDLATSKAKSKLESQFDSVIEALGSNKGSMKSLLLAPVVQREQASWSASGSLPWSAPMRSSLKSYIQSHESARQSLERTLAKISREAAAANDEHALALLKAAESDAPAPVVVGVWRCVGARRGTITLYSDGHLSAGSLNEMSHGGSSGSSRTPRRATSKGEQDSLGKWSFRGDGLDLKIANSRSRNGFEDERCVLLPDGTKFTASNQFRKSFTATRGEAASGVGESR